MEVNDLVPVGPSALVPSASSRIGDLVAAWLTSYGASTRAAYGRDLAHFIAWSVDEVRQDPLAARRPHLELYARHLEENLGRSRKTVARRLAALASFYGYLVDEQLLERSPAEHVRRPRVSRDSPRLGLSRGELGRLLRAAESAGPLEHALIALLALNGLRVSEATAITLEDLGEERGHRVVRIIGKGEKPAVAPLAPPTAAAVDELVAARNDDPGSHTSADIPASMKDLQAPTKLFGELDRFGAFRIVRRLAAEAGIRKTISPHSLRHTFCTLALDAGIPIVDVQVAMRHASPATTMHYDRARRELESAATYRLTEFLDER